MLVISTISILLFAAGAVFRRLQEQASHSNPDRKILRLGVQIICGDCCGDADRPVKTYIDQFGRCVQCGGGSYVLASMYAVVTQAYSAKPCSSVMIRGMAVPTMVWSSADSRRQSASPPTAIHSCGPASPSRALALVPSRRSRA